HALRVRPFVRVVVAAGADEGRRPETALVVDLVTAAVPPTASRRIGCGLAGLVTEENLLVLHRRQARLLAAGAARIGLDGVLGGVGSAAHRTVIGAEGQPRSAARGVSGTVVGIRGARDDHLVDGAGVEGV